MRRPKRSATRARLLGRAVSLLIVVAVAFTTALSSGAVASAYTIMGSIKAEYDELVKIGRSPGAAISDELDDRQGGKFQKFVNNNYIYWNSRVDPSRGRQVGGAIWDKWGNYDWENGPLGYPIEREGDVTRGGKISRFEGGVIYYSGATGAHPVWGQILQTWAASGYEQSAYGFPTGDEEVIGSGRRQLFENGQYIEWQPEGFPEDWEGDSQQDDDTSDNTDAFFPSCGSNCANDATVRVTGHPVTNNTGVGARSAGPQAANGDTTAEDGTPYCDSLQPDPDAAPGDGVLCLVREGAEPGTAADPNALDGASEAPTTEPSTPQTPVTPDSVPETEPQLGSGSTGSPPPSAGSAPSSVPDAPMNPAPATPECTTTTTAPTTTTTAPSAIPSTPIVPTGSCSQPQAPQQDSGSTGTPATTTDSTPTSGEAFNLLSSSKALGPARTVLPNSENYCANGDPDFAYKVWKGDRMFQCRTKVITIGMAELRTAKYYGSIYVEEQRTVKLAWNNTAWDEALGVRVQNVIPNPSVADALTTLQSVQLKWELTCQYSPFISCYNNGGVSNTIGPQSVANLQTQYTTTTRKGAFAPGGGYTNAQSSWRFTATQPKFTTASGLTGYTPLIRCDAGVGLRNSQGCAFTHVKPILDYNDYSDIGDFINHVRSAQQSGLAGDPDGNPLNRVTARATIRQNRAGSCGGVTGPRTSGKSCDEYPFASTDQGARVNGPYSGDGRTFANCGIKDNDLKNVTGSTGYSVCIIDRGQNSRAGSILGWFYAKNRVMDADAFFVDVE